MSMAPTPGDRAAQMRASDQDRERVSGALGTAFSEGRLTRDEYDQRIDQALHARTMGELAVLTQDVSSEPDAAAQVPTPVVASGPHSWRIEPSGRSRSRLVWSMFGSATRRGNWRVPARLKTFTMYGGQRLDLVEATFESPETEISVFTMFGGQRIFVPADAHVTNEVVSIFGGTRVVGTSRPAPGAPVIRVRGFVAFGGVRVVVSE